MASAGGLAGRFALSCAPVTDATGGRKVVPVEAQRRRMP